MTDSKEPECADKLHFDDVIVRYLGEFGKYQRFIFLLVCIPTLITAMDSLSWTFVGAKVHSRCRGPSETADSDYWSPATPSLYQNCTKEEFAATGTCYLRECRIGDTNSCPAGYIYDKSQIRVSAMARWDLVCDRLVLRAFIQAAYYIGQMIGSIVFGYLGDRFGRKRLFFIALVVQFFSGIMMIFAPHWTLYALGRGGVGFSHPGIFVMAVVIGVELIGPNYRQLASILTALFWCFGEVVLGLLAYSIRDYQYLHVAITMPALAFVSYWWIIPESARWLVTRKRFEEADVILQKVARVNNRHLPSNWHKVLIDETTESRSEIKHHTYWDLFRTPVVRKRAFACFLCWPICSMMYYGISMNANFLGGDLYWTFIIGGLSEIPSVIVSYFLIQKIGRKPVLAGGFLTAAVAMLSSLLFDSKTHVAIGITQSLVSKSAMACTYATLYAFTPELFPTVIRNSAMGVCSMIARVGAISASFMSMWLVDKFGVLVMVLPFAALAILAAVVTLVFLPETAGRKLHERIEDVEQSGE